MSMKMNFFGTNKKTVAARNLRMESLEDRMLLAVVAGCEDGDASAALVGAAQPTEGTVIINDLSESTLKAAIANANAGDTILFAQAGTVTLSSTITIDKNISIDGAGKVTIDAAGQDRIFNVSESVRYFNLDNLTLTGGHASGDGGVFDLPSSSSATLTNCTVTGNSADSLGGAFNVYGKLFLNSCTVSNNSSASAGGAMFIEGMWNNGSARVEANNTIFYANKSGTEATESFGGVVENQCGNLIMNNCSVVGNIATYGAITNWGCLLTGDSYSYYTASTELNDTIVAYNYGYDEACADIYEYYGDTSDGAYLNAGKESLFDNFKCNNSIVGLQGEFFVEAPEFDQDGNIVNADTVDLTIRSDSAAARYQIGAFPTVYSGEDYSDANLIVTTLDDVVDGNDGVVSLREALIYAELGEFADVPTITFASELQGGTIYLTKGALAINASVSIEGNGVTIDAQGQSRVFFAKSYDYQIDIPGIVTTGLSLDQCPAHNYSDQYMIKVSLSNLTITGGKSGVSYYYNAGGGVLANQNVQLAMNNCTVTGNTFINYTGHAYLQGGGGIGMLGYSTLQMNNCTVSNNKNYALAYDGGTNLYGGGIFTAVHAVAEITNTTISGNQITTAWADSDQVRYGSFYAWGGGVYSAGDLTTLRYCTITDNLVRGAVAEQGGGGVYNATKTNARQATNNWSLRIDNSTIQNNKVGDNNVDNNGCPRGAGIYSKGYTVLVSDLIADNVCEGGSVNGTNSYGGGSRGAGIFNDHLFAAYSCTIAGNTCTMVDDSGSTLTTGELKAYGAGVFNTGSGAITIKGSIIIDNVSQAVNSTAGTTSKSDSQNSGNFTRAYSIYEVAGSGGTYTDTGMTRRSLTKPLFTDSASGDYTLPSNSQAVDKIADFTEEGGVPVFYNWDLRNDPWLRVYNGLMDYGCYEYQPEPEPTPTFECTVADYIGVYDAAYHTITVNGMEEGDTLYYSNDGVNYSTDTIQYAATGKRTVYVKVVREGHQDWFGSGKVEISQLQLTVSGTTVDDKDYDGTAAATAHIGTVSGLIEGDDVTVTPVTEFPSADPGTYDLNVRYTLSGAQASNYIAPVTETISATIAEEAVTKLSVTVIVSASAAAATELDILPESIESATLGQTLYAQIWIKNMDGSDLGCTGGYVDLGYTANLAVGQYFNSSVYASESNRSDLSVEGVAACLGGCTASGVNDKAVSQWALLGTVSFTASVEGVARVIAQEPTLNGRHIQGLNLSRAGEGNLKAGEIEYTFVQFEVAGGGQQLDAPSITNSTRSNYISFGANRHQLQWTAVEGAAGYEVSYSEDGETWKTVQATDTKAVITGLTYGADVQYKVKALGTGAYSDSDWSRVKEFNVCPMDINGDGEIAGADRALLANSWMAEEGDDEYFEYADINADGEIAAMDRTYIANNWMAEAGDDDLVYPRPVRADAVSAAFASGIDVDLDVF